jgi:hypothetical protein
MGALFDLIMCAAISAIAVIIYPILKQDKESIAVGYAIARTIEVIIIIIGSIGLLSLVTISQDFETAGAADASHLQALGDLLIVILDWVFLLGPVIAFSLTAVVLNYSFYQSKLVPRFISLWGLIGSIMMLSAGLFGMFGLSISSPIFILLSAPIAVNEMVLAIWLIVKGFNPSAIDT